MDIQKSGVHKKIVGVFLYFKFKSLIMFPNKWLKLNKSNQFYIFKKSDHSLTSVNDNLISKYKFEQDFAAKKGKIKLGTYWMQLSKSWP